MPVKEYELSRKVLNNMYLRRFICFTGEGKEEEGKHDLKKNKQQSENYNNLKTNHGNFWHAVLLYSHEYFKIIEKHHLANITWKFSGS